MFTMNHSLDRFALTLQALLKPFHNRHYGGILFPQPLDQLHDKSVRNDLTLLKPICD